MRAGLWKVVVENPARLSPNRLAIVATGMVPAASSARAASRSSSDSFGPPLPTFPALRATAALSPAMVRSRLRSRKYFRDGAQEPEHHPAVAVSVSTCSVSERSLMPRSAACVQSPASRAATGEAVDLPNHQLVLRGGGGPRGQRLLQLGTLGADAAALFLKVDLAAAGRAQRVLLKGEALLVGGHTRVADEHVNLVPLHRMFDNRIVDMFHGHKLGCFGGPNDGIGGSPTNGRFADVRGACGGAELRHEATIADAASAV